MTLAEEMVIKRRLESIESELARLKLIVAGLESRLAAPVAETPEPALESEIAPSDLPPPAAVETLSPPPAVFETPLPPPAIEALPPPLPVVEVPTPSFVSTDDVVPPALPPPLPSWAQAASEVTVPLSAPEPVKIPEFRYTPPKPRVEEPAPAPKVNHWREWLEPLQLWPPEGEENAEVRLAAWWATRVGALLAVVGLVFLGIYVSQNTPPWVRLVELVAVTGGVIGLGSWLERKLPTFGAVVFGAGLALAYFCAFAAYAVAPMKVITSPLVATGCELVVVGGIFGVAWWRNSPIAATMGVALGYVTAFLGLRGEPLVFGPWVVLLLGLVAVLLRIVRGWQAPSALAMPLTWVFLTVASLAVKAGHEMPLTAVWTWTALHFALFMARDWIKAWQGGRLETYDRALQVTNSSLGVAVGLLATLRAGDHAAVPFFFGSGVAILLAAWAWRAVRDEALVPVLVCKGASLVALGIIDHFAGQARCLVLLAQAFVMLVSARQSHQRWLRTATVIAGVVAFGFFLAGLGDPVMPGFGRAAALEAIFLAGAVGFVAASRRWLDYNAEATAVAAGIVGVTAAITVWHWQLAGWLPAGSVAMALVLVAAAASVRGWLSAVIAGGIVLVAAHVELWVFPQHLYSRAILWGNELCLLAATAAVVPATARLVDEAGRKLLRWIVAALGASTLVVALYKGLAPGPALAASTALVVGLIALASRAKGWPLADLAAPLQALALGEYLVLYPQAADGWLWLALGAAWLAPLWLTIWPASRDGIGSARGREWAPAAHTALATATTLLVLYENLTGADRIWGAGLAALAVFGFAWKLRLRPALEASWVLWSTTLLAGMLESGRGLWFAAVAGWLPAIVLARVASAAALRESPPRWRPHAATFQVALATALVWCALQQNLMGPERVWGATLAALAVFGIAWGVRLRSALESSWVLWAVALVAVLDSAAAVSWLPVLAWVPAIVLARMASAASLRESPPWWRMHAATIQVALATALVWCVLWRNLAGPERAWGATLAALAVFGIAWGARLRSALESSWVFWATALVAAAVDSTTGASWFTALAAWVPAILLVRVPALTALGAERPGWRTHAPVVQTILATLAAGVVAFDYSGSARLLAFGAGVGVALGVWRFGGVAAARPAAAALAAALWGSALDLAWRGGAEGWSDGLATVLGVAVLAGALSFLVERGLEREERTRLRWVTAGAGLLLTFVVFGKQQGAVAPYATVGWGLAAMATFFAGLLARSRPHRLLGLAGLALCVPRAFMVDLHSTLYRIGAFVALGVVLLWVGFSYHRFRHLVVDDEKKP